MLAELRTKLLLEKQRNRTLLNTRTGRPLLESACVANVNNTLELNRRSVAQENTVIPTSRQQTSHKSMVDYLFMVRFLFPFPLIFMPFFYLEKALNFTNLCMLVT